MRQFKIRLKRIGRWHKPLYEVVVVFSSSKVRGGKIFEKLGFYSPASAVKFFFINFFRLSHWLVVGAAVSPAVGGLLGKLAPLRATTSARARVKR